MMNEFPALCAVCGDVKPKITVQMTDSTGITYPLRFHAGDCYRAHIEYQNGATSDD